MLEKDLSSWETTDIKEEMEERADSGEGKKFQDFWDIFYKLYFYLFITFDVDTTLV
jgi:hypothetical protein